MTKTSPRRTSRPSFPRSTARGSAARIAGVCAVLAALGIGGPAHAQRISLSAVEARVQTLEGEDDASTGQLVILAVIPDEQSQTLSIEGVNFGLDTPTVWLDGAPLAVDASDDVSILTPLPLLPPGSYLLTVEAGEGRDRFDAFELTLGAAGPQGPPGPRGLQGVPGPAGPGGVWRNVDTRSCPANAACQFNVPCFSTETAVSGMCGDAGTANEVRVVYSGRQPNVASAWLCKVSNPAGVPRTINLGTYCVR